MTRAEIIQKGLQMQADYEKKKKPAGEVIGEPMNLRIGGEEVYCLHYPSKNRKNGPVYIDIHGGGFLWGYPEEDDTLCARVNQVLDIEVYSLEYPRSPLHMFPEAPNSLFRSISYLCEHAYEFNFDAEKVCVGGHSAGGNLTMAVMQMNICDPHFKVCCQVLDYPALDIRHGAVTDEMFKKGDILSVDLIEFFTDAYALDKDLNNPLCNPVLADDETLSHMPQTVIMTCGNDVLRFQGREMADRLRNVNIGVIHYEYPNVVHAFDVFEGPDMQKGQDFLINGMRYYLDI